MSEEEIKKMFSRIEQDKASDSCGFEFADGFGCTFDNIATCYDDRLKLYELVKKLQQENSKLKDKWNKLKEIVKSQSDFKLKVRNKELWFEVDELLSKMEELEKGVNNE